VTAGSALGNGVSTILVRHFTDPGCPWAFSAEPIRYRLLWHYGDALAWRTTLIVLSEHPEENGERGLTVERFAAGLDTLQRRYGMPIDATRRERVPVTLPACRAVVGARVFAPELADALLRQLRVRAMGGGLLDDPALIRDAASAVGIDAPTLAAWAADPNVEATLRADMRAARSPTPAAHALDHKLAGTAPERRYTAPSYVLRHEETGAELTLPGFHPVEAYEAAIANLAPELERRAAPASVDALLEWAGEPLATAEVALVCGLSPEEARTQLARVARPVPAGADFYWTLPPAERALAA
jgi:2-hydroxychromene-2-carboxylate isomerase